jgi:hypothetical protein
MICALEWSSPRNRMMPAVGWQADQERGERGFITTRSYANLIAAKLPELQIVDLDLTLEGLRVIASRNFPQ